MKFRTTIVLGGKTATGFQVPDEIVASLGSNKRPPVRVTIGDHSYRSTVATMGGMYMLPLSAENRMSAGVSAGDEVEVDIELDHEPREVELPTDFSELLAHDNDAKCFFDNLSYSNKRRYVLWIEQAKKAETRQARVIKAVGMLREGRLVGE